MEDLDLTILCTCFHCNREIGTLSQVIEGPTHECFIKYDEITFDNSSNVAKGIFKSPAATEDLKNVPAFTSNNFISTWTDPAVKLLIATYKELKAKFTSPQHNKKTVWGLISQKLEGNGIKMTATKCDEKWRNLKKKYDAIRRSNQETGNSNSSWKHFHDLHEIYFKDPLFSPLAIVSSTGGITVRSDTSIPSTSKFSPTGSSAQVNNDHTPKSGKKRNTSAIEELEKKRQARHDEKMKFKKEVFEWLKLREANKTD